jgi:hypothetical protein
MQLAAVVSLTICVLLATGVTPGVAPVSPTLPPHLTEHTVTTHARGTFEVQITPLVADEYADAATMGRMLIDKQFSGDISGTGKGQMITGMGSVKGSAAYSAIERVTGAVSGKRGSFMLQHTGIMHDGTQELTITIVPASGTGELTGIAGTFALTIEGKVHRYDLAYTLPTTP